MSQPASHPEQENLDLLNHLLHGMHIGNQSLQSFINALDDDQLRHQLEKMEKQYLILAQEFSSHIRDLGGTPSDSTGVSGTMAKLSTIVSNAMAETPLDIINEISKGLNMGIDSFEQVLPKLKGSSKTIVEKSLQSARTMFQQLETTKRQYLH